MMRSLVKDLKFEFIVTHSAPYTSTTVPTLLHLSIHYSSSIMRSLPLITRHASRIHQHLSTTTTIKHHRCASTLLFHDLFNPTPEHAQLRSMLRDFVQKEVRVFCVSDVWRLVFSRVCSINQSSKSRWNHKPWSTMATKNSIGNCFNN